MTALIEKPAEYRQEGPDATAETTQLAPNNETKRRAKASISLKTRLLTLVGVGILGAVILGFTGAMNTVTAANELDKVVEINENIAGRIHLLNDLQIQNRVYIAQMAAADTAEARNEWRKKMRELDWQIEDLRAQAEQRIGAEIPEFGSFQANYDAFFDTRENEVIPHLESADGHKGFSAYYAQTMQPLIDAYVTDLEGVNERVQGMYDESVAAAASAKNTAIITICVVWSIVILILLFTGMRTVTAIRRALGALSASIAAMARGDLTVPALVYSGDELGQTSAQLNTARGALAGILLGVQKDSVAVSSSAQQLGRNGEDLSAGAEESSSQASAVAASSGQVATSVQSVAAGAEEMGASIREIASNAAEAARVAVRATSVAAATNETVAKLGDSSREIGAVVRTINSIAEQTNLLALNATIEAARAGEAGKGFAVVAGEVKELAGETARATEDISRRVEAIQVDAVSAVEAITEISEIIATINDYQGTIASSVEEQTATTSEMSRSVSEAAAGVSDMSDNISAVAAASNQSSMAVAHMSAATAELAQLAQDLQAKVSAFRF